SPCLLFFMSLLFEQVVRTGFVIRLRLIFLLRLFIRLRFVSALRLRCVRSKQFGGCRNRSRRRRCRCRHWWCSRQRSIGRWLRSFLLGRFKSRRRRDWLRQCRSRGRRRRVESYRWLLRRSALIRFRIKTSLHRSRGSKLCELLPKRGQVLRQ